MTPKPRKKLLTYLIMAYFFTSLGWGIYKYIERHFASGAKTEFQAATLTDQRSLANLPDQDKNQDSNKNSHRSENTDLKNSRTIAAKHPVSKKAAQEKALNEKIKLAGLSKNSPKTFPQEIQRRIDQRLTHLQQWPSIKSLNNNYVILDTLVAEKANETNPSSSEAVSLPLPRNFVAFPSDSASKKLPAIAYNTRTKRLGLVTGIIKVKFQDDSTYTELMNDLNLKLVKSFDHIRLALFQVESTENFEQILVKIRAYPGVIRANPEVVESDYSTQ